MVEIIGVIGVVCIVLAWIPETVDAIKKGKTHIPLPFLLLYIVGSSSLIAYSVILFDFVFITLNSLATLQSLVHLYYHFFPR